MIFSPLFNPCGKSRNRSSIGSHKTEHAISHPRIALAYFLRCWLSSMVNLYIANRFVIFSFSTIWGQKRILKPLKIWMELMWQDFPRKCNFLSPLLPFGCKMKNENCTFLIQIQKFHFFLLQSKFQCLTFLWTDERIDRNKTIYPYISLKVQVQRTQQVELTLTWYNLYK